MTHVDRFNEHIRDCEKCRTASQRKEVESLCGEGRDLMEAIEGLPQFKGCSGRVFRFYETLTRYYEVHAESKEQAMLMCKTHPELYCLPDVFTSELTEDF